MAKKVQEQQNTIAMSVEGASHFLLSALACPRERRERQKKKERERGEGGERHVYFLKPGNVSEFFNIIEKFLIMSSNLLKVSKLMFVIC